MGTEEVVIIPYRDGPYLVRGPASLRDQDGREIDPGRRTIALCRCGKSRLRPFCDGSHHLVRFRAPSEPEVRGGSAAPADGPGPAPNGRAAPNGRPAPAVRNAAPNGLPTGTTSGDELAEVERDLARLQQRLARLAGRPDARQGGSPLGESARLLRVARLLETASTVLQAGGAKGRSKSPADPGVQP